MDYNAAEEDLDKSYQLNPYNPLTLSRRARFYYSVLFSSPIDKSENDTHKLYKTSPWQWSTNPKTSDHMSFYQKSHKPSTNSPTKAKEKD